MRTQLTHQRSWTAQLVRLMAPVMALVMVPVMALVMVLVMTLPSRGEAGTLGSIIGYVKGKDGKPLQGVQVTVTSPFLMGKQVMRTDVQGFYRVTQLPPGDGYRLQFDVAEWQPTERLVSRVHAGMTFRAADVPLRPIMAATLGIEPMEQSPMLDFSWSGTAQVQDAGFLELIPLQIRSDRR